MGISKEKFLSNRDETGRMERKTDYKNIKTRTVNGNCPSSPRGNGLPDSFEIGLTHAQTAYIRAKDIAIFDLVSRALACGILLVQTVDESTVIQNMPH